MCLFDIKNTIHNKMFSLIVATDCKFGIGKFNSLPWRNKPDMLNFKSLTLNNVVVMGGGTWRTLPIQPLPKRYNVVLSKEMSIFSYDSRTVRSIDEIIKLRKKVYPNKEWFIIGGSFIYNYFLENQHLLNKVYWTQFHKDYECDVKLKYGMDIFQKPNWDIHLSDRSKWMNNELKGCGIYKEIYSQC